ncbi:mevalonate kinase [Litorihabitans aurantiacus]|uniref:mevalonate kinase n=1 Tax=Litorihabitans aurantiacus TaxID=1930061 RepID=A0AA37UTH2_9MICO|nr:mevalonate kinase [Litorihabitans aurantiacus]GMA30222.1 mevalonate kinase [Litorihabitans aurantiacus]
MLRTGRGVAHAKVILFGEHAVVHGEPAIAMPLDVLGVRATVRHRPGELSVVSDLYTGPLAQAPELMSSPRAVVHAALDRVGLPLRDLEIAVVGDVPHARGLGSSAAVAGALVRAIADYAGVTLTEAEHLALVDLGERLAHGTPSGLDARATSADAMVWFEAGVARRLATRTSAVLVVADSGLAGRTRTAVADVAAFLERRPVRGAALIAGLGALAQGAALDLAAGRAEQVGAKMSQAQGMLRELGVSSPELDALIDAATAAGALGAKLTGGGQGGCVIALVRDEAGAVVVDAAMRAAGAVTVWHHPIGPDGAAGVASGTSPDDVQVETT